MTTLPFPNQPKDGDVHVINGKVYRYDAGVNAWRVVGAEPNPGATGASGPGSSGSGRQQ